MIDTEDKDITKGEVDAEDKNITKGEVDRA